MAVEWTVLIRAAGPIATRVALPPIQKWTVPWRVARAVRKRAKREELPRPPPYWPPLKRYLSEGHADTAFQSGDQINTIEYLPISGG